MSEKMIAPSPSWSSSGSSNSQTADKPARPRVPIYLFGDSLTARSFNYSTEGFGWRLQTHYGSRAEVFNRGVDGATTRSQMEFFDKTLLEELQRTDKPEPLFVTIFFGTNDSCEDSWASVPLDEFERNLRHYVDSILNLPNIKSTKVILITPPMINVPTPEPDQVVDVEMLKLAPGYLAWKSKRVYAAKVMEIARSYSAKTLRVIGFNLWGRLCRFAQETNGGREDDEEMIALAGYKQVDMLINIEDDDGEVLPGCGLPGAITFTRNIFSDGVHFGFEGYKIMTEQLLRLITDAWADVRI